MMSVLSGKEIYCLSNLIARYSSWILYWKGFLSIGWTREMWIQNKWNCSDLLTREMCKTVYKVFDIMKDCSFMNLYIYQIFSPCHAHRANPGCDINFDSNLISLDVRSQGLRRAGGSFCELTIEIWFTKDKILILREFNLLWRVTRWFFSWNIMMKKFLSKINAFSSLERW